MKESDIQAAIMSYLLWHPRVAWAYVTSTGKFKGLKGGSIITIGFPGMSDIIGQMKDGRLLAIEVKMPKNKPTKEQADFIYTVNKSNGLAGWVTSVDEVKEIIGNKNP